MGIALILCFATLAGLDSAGHEAFFRQDKTGPSSDTALVARIVELIAAEPDYGKVVIDLKPLIAGVDTGAQRRFHAQFASAGFKRSALHRMRVVRESPPRTRVVTIAFDQIQVRRDTARILVKGSIRQNNRRESEWAMMIRVVRRRATWTDARPEWTSASYPPDGAYRIKASIAAAPMCRPAARPGSG